MVQQPPQPEREQVFEHNAHPRTASLLQQGWNGFKKGVGAIATSPMLLAGALYESRDPFVMTLRELHKDAKTTDRKAHGWLTPEAQKGAHAQYRDETIMPELKKMHLLLDGKIQAEQEVTEASDIAYPGWRSALNKAAAKGREGYLKRLDKKVGRSINKIETRNSRA